MIFVSFKTASQFPTNRVDCGVCNVPSLDSEQSPGSTRIEMPLAGDWKSLLEQPRQEQSKDKGQTGFLYAYSS